MSEAKRKLIRDKAHPFLYRDENSGVWVIRASHRGRKLFRSTGESVSFARAIRRAKDLLAEFHGADAKPEMVLFKHLGAEVIQSKKGLAYATHMSAEIHIGIHLNAFFANLPVQEIDEKTWADYVTRHRESGRKLFNDWKHFRMVMLRAFNRGVISRKIIVKNPDPKEDLGREFTDMEIAELLQHAPNDLALQIHFALFMGMRVNEILSLEWENIDIDNAELKVWDRKRRRFRYIKVNERYLIPLLKVRSVDKKSRFVFPHRFDLNAHQTTIKKVWTTCREAAKVKGKFHWLRHTCASKRARAGMPPALIQSDLGMSDQVMKKIYLHLTKEDRKQMANCFELPTQKDVQTSARSAQIARKARKK